MSKVWSARYALTDGIIHEEVQNIDLSGQYFLVGRFVGHKLGRDVFINKHEAVEKAEEMRIAKIKSLKKQIEKLEELKFEV